MGKEKTTVVGEARFASRVFVGADVTSVSIRGHGLTGKWVLRVDAKERRAQETVPAVFAVEFLPAHLKYCRVNMIGEAAADAACGSDRLLNVPEEVLAAFDAFVQQELQRRHLTMRRSRQGPRYLLRQLATMLVQQEIQPGAQLREEIEKYICSHFFEHPDFVGRVEKSSRQYHFGDPLVGRFFMTEIPALGD